MTPYTFTETLAYLESERKVCVKHSQTASSTPEIISWYYVLHTYDIGPVQAAKLPLGAPVEERKDAHRGAWYYCNGIKLGYIAGDQQAILRTSTPYPCPKVRKGVEVRYHNGHWERWYKTSGAWGALR